MTYRFVGPYNEKGIRRKKFYDIPRLSMERDQEVVRSRVGGSETKGSGGQKGEK